MSVSSDSQGGSSHDLCEKWDARYRETECWPTAPAVLAENRHLLPLRGRALDLAAGLGSGALLLAEEGLDVEAWDLSPVAIGRLEAEADRQGLAVRALTRDIQAHPPPPDSFDIILVAHFLDRNLAPAIAAALRPGGLLFYQTFVRESVNDCGPSNPAYRLGENELLRLFSGLLVRLYREEGCTGDLTLGTRDIAMLIAQRVEESNRSRTTRA